MKQYSLRDINGKIVGKGKNGRIKLEDYPITDMFVFSGLLYLFTAKGIYYIEPNPIKSRKEKGKSP